MIRRLCHRLYSIVTGQRFNTSADYWQSRYGRGGTSGSGSYGRLAEFKAGVLNDLVATHAIRSVIELGSGDGSQLALAQYPAYLGVDISPVALEACKASFVGDSNKTFISLDTFRRDRPMADLSLSLDVIYHLVEDDVFAAHMLDLFGAARRFVAIYSSNSDQIFSPTPHVRHRRFSNWVERQAGDWRLAATHKNPYPFSWQDRANTSPADLYVFEKIALAAD
jgi:SAM-dependent methyltransferase